jgi:hypothetical protein
MSSKNYFVKVSWQNPKQPLIRVHANTKVDLDLSCDVWDISTYIQRELMSRNVSVKQFTVDFMIECGD